MNEPKIDWQTVAREMGQALTDIALKVEGKQASDICNICFTVLNTYNRAQWQHEQKRKT